MDDLRGAPGYWLDVGVGVMKAVLVAALAGCLVFGAGAANAAFQAPDNQDPLAALEQGLRPNVLPPGEGSPGWSLAERMRHYNVPGVAIAVVRNGEVVRATGFGVREAGTQDRVDGD